MTELLWTKRSEHYVVELLVGRAWVNHGTYRTLSEAQREERRMVNDDAVSEARTVAHSFVHRCELESSTTGEAVASIPKTMRPTGALGACPACGSEGQQVAWDGATSWLVCAPCGRALPVSNAHA